MHIDLLIGDIVRQTTVLIAQLSTSAGLRAPLAKVADQVFLDLSRELAAQGVRKKVAADMFGLALRTYQVKVHRIQEGLEEARGTLWQDIYRRLEESSVTRKELQAHFRREDPARVAAIVQDMTESGIAYCSGRGDATLYGLTDERDRAHLSSQDSALDDMIWYLVATDAARTRDELLLALKCDPTELDRLLVKLVECGKLTLHDTRYGARRLEIQSGAERGWEVAVCDHFRAMTTAVANKVAHFGEHKKYIGGGTVSFRIDHGHPLRQRVLDQLEAVRAQVDALWREVADYNEQHGVAETFSRVTFYFGQNVVEGDSAFEVSK